jgi:drug/metabolite transporter (DMT)-like permease
MRQGALLLVAGMACFALSDAMAKQLTAVASAAALSWVRYAVLLATVLPMAAMQPAHWRSRRPGLQFARSAALVASAILFMLGLGALPVAEATAMVFASPLFITTLAVLVLREHVPPARWAPVLLGFAGVLVVARPGGAAFGFAAFWPISSSIAWAVAVTCTRRLSAVDSTATTMLYSSIGGTVVLLPFTPLGELAALPAADLVRLVAMAAAWSAAQWFVIAAYRVAAAASIAPFGYTQLVWAGLLGVVVFGHVPDATSLAGMAIILASGVLAAWRAR